MATFIKMILESVIDLFFPRLCPGCSDALVENEDFLCTRCILELPKTNFHLVRDNEVAQIFWGRIPVMHATAYLYFQKEGRVQKMIHELKYNGRKDIGIKLGEMMARDLMKSDFKDVDVIVPVPLHKRKKWKRGYNQTELIAEGLVRVMCKPMDTKTLLRAIANPTQTKKHRYERWENVERIFKVKNYSQLENKHILLVDDIITTGATLEASAVALLEIPGVKISIAAVGMA